MADAKRKPSDILMRASDKPEMGDVGRSLTPQKTQREQHYFVSDEEQIARPAPSFEHKLKFQYKGDVFAQRGLYADATLYMSRLPPTRKAAAIRQKAGANYKMQVKLAPMSQPDSEVKSGEKANKVGKKRQYIVAVEAMASNPALHANLLSDNVIPNILTLCRTKDLTTLASCVSTMCHLSCEAAGRQAILSHNALAILVNLVANIAHEKRILNTSLATLANLTIEDTFESTFVKEKALESIVMSRKVSELAEAMSTFAIFNLSCPNFSYPRVEDVIHALIEYGKDSRGDRETLSRAIYNFSCTKMNQFKLVESPETISMLRTYISNKNPESVRLNALVSFWHLSDNATCRRAIIRSDCVCVIVKELKFLSDDEHIKCALLILLNLSSESAARELMGSAKALDALDQLSKRVTPTSTDLQILIYELIAIILSDPNNIHTVSESFFRFLLSFEHSVESKRTNMSCYVLFSLTCILSWSDQEENSGVISRDATSGALFTDSRAHLSSCQSLEQLLDEPQHLQLVYRHVEHDGFDAKSSELYLQVMLLYNLSFRYNKVDVARLAAAQLAQLASVSREERVLSLLCGIYFNLCQEYDVHLVFSGNNTLSVLERFARFCEDDTKSMCLEVVCIIFDGRKLPQTELVELAVKMFPVLAEICASGGTAIRAGCAACFARFAMIDECRLPMVKSGLIASLAILVSEDDAQILRLCVHAYSYLSRNPTVCSTLIHSGIIKSLTYLAAAPEEAVRRACAMTLCNISTSDENIDALVKYGALRALLVISCVKSNDPETRRICMKSVMNLLRHEKNVAQMCQDGLLWAFGLFVDGMEPKDYDIVSDAFCALAFYPATRKGTMKAPILTQIFQIVHSSASLPTKVKLLKGISNLLCDPSSASLLIHAGVLSHLVHLIEEENHDVDIKALLAHILVLLFQSSTDSAESEFAKPSTVRAVVEIMKGERDDCSACCCMLLLRMSSYPQTRRALVQANAFAALPSLFIQTSKDSQTHLVRCIYNISCDAELLPAIAGTEILPYVAMTAHNHEYAMEIAKLGAGILRNLSCEASCHHSLMTETSMAMLRDLYDVDDSQCKEDVGICVCNLFLGKSNTNFLLSMAVLPLVLWLCSHHAIENRALCSAVLRKLAIAPGNTQILVDGGAIGPLALLMQQCASLYVKKNCIAIFCLISQKPGIPGILGSVGIISSVLELLDDEVNAKDALFETMCVDLLSKLAEFARANDPREGRISSILYELMDRDDRPTTSAGGTWQSDRSFLSRDPNAGGQLPLPKLSKAHWVAPSQLPVIRHTLYPLLSRGYSVEFNLVASHIDTHTIEPLIPDFWALRESSTNESDTQSGILSKSHKQQYLATSSVAFVPPEMYVKNRTPFTPSAAAAASTSSSSLSPSARFPNSSNSSEDRPPSTPGKRVPPIMRRRSAQENGPHVALHLAFD